MTVAGNHEIERDSSGKAFQSWSARYPNPHQQSNSSSNQYYSFDYAGDYNTYNSHYKEVECFQQQIEDVLHKYGVNFAFFGHVHAYERTNPLLRYMNDPCGTVHITIGDGGNIEGMEPSFGHGILELKSPYEATFQWFRNQDNLPVVADNVTVVRDLRCPNQGAPVKQPGV
ncbi:Metallo-dependent phosphatase [Coccomyxa subellipsoidea C-169]|uniref:Metallo-dependent phosphatase n=1 Tax=Coccomyxa subellipsoidea (strain C-169) TaxID=574566 RepID=I0Z0S1_COCSC|nr:Metallo-dependent phosphatase [Coccomyxa subellipsoidea C-169]EIE24240.1 Metallo-dependent phosphatase [Coccomyxa subellipsoidea C-169]|eukprot:XP_005648784.1 Metallo-dependent phosphatase [Coccomyxa subellipsoidea C-169]